MKRATALAAHCREGSYDGRGMPVGYRCAASAVTWPNVRSREEMSARIRNGLAGFIQLTAKLSSAQGVTAMAAHCAACHGAVWEQRVPRGRRGTPWQASNSTQRGQCYSTRCAPCGVCSEGWYRWVLLCQLLRGPTPRLTLELCMLRGLATRRTQQPFKPAYVHAY